MDVRKTPEFEEFLVNLSDIQAKVRIASRVARLGAGNPGDVKSVGHGISEMRIDYGPGYRVYFKKFGTQFIVLLCAGDKSTQAKDIKSAHSIAETYLWQ
jgi:putative addiction module killer protein